MALHALTRRSAPLCAAVLVLSGCGRGDSASAAAHAGATATAQASLRAAPPTARVIASGIPGVSAIAQVGPFHRGSPIHDSPSWTPFTQPGRVLHAARLLVASTSNFGAPLARPGDPEGAILSLDVSGGPVAVPPAFAGAGGQASALGGLVQIFAAQSPAFLNGLNNPGAATRDLPAASLPLGISLNIGNGRPWLANAPNGAHGDGTITVLDADGRPLAGAPSAVAGGVFGGDLTNRGPQTAHGLTAAAIATALLTRSPDGSGRAVFAAVLADGSVEQVHVQRGVDALAPPASITPVDRVDRAVMESADRDAVGRVGAAFNWVPNLALFVTDPLRDRVMVLDLTTDGTLFVAAPPRYLESPAFDRPVDIAPAMPEFAAGNFSSASSLGGGSDLYVLNRGNNTVVRIDQSGRPVAIRAIRPETDVPGLRAAGIGVSPDGRSIYVTATAPGRQGYVLKMDPFGDTFVTKRMVASAAAAGASDLASLGTDMFSRDLGVLDLVGPLFNGQSCADCHNTPSAGGASPSRSDEERVARIDGNEIDQLLFRGGPVTRRHSIRELGFPCGLPTGVPPEANVVSPRMAMTLLGDGLIDSIQVQAILALPATQPAAVRGHPAILPDGRLGKFGWKATTPALVEFIADAFRSEQGVTNPMFPHDFVRGCGAGVLDHEIDGMPLTAVSAFVGTLDPPQPTATCLGSPGAERFATIGCANCHTPSLPSEGIQARLYSDLLLHEMGPGLADGLPEGAAGGGEFRTMPLWRVSERPHLLHDGRADTIEQAIGAHGGQAEAARNAFQSLGPADRQALLDFLGCI